MSLRYRPVRPQVGVQLLHESRLAILRPPLGLALCTRTGAGGGMGVGRQGSHSPNATGSRRSRSARMHVCAISKTCRDTTPLVGLWM